MKPKPFDSLNHFTVPFLRMEIHLLRSGLACLFSRELRQRIDTDRWCFEPCRVPTLMLKCKCEATPLQVSKASGMPFEPARKTAVRYRRPHTLSTRSCPRL